MHNIPTDLKYTKTHEWARLEADGTVTVGITDHAQSQLGDMVFAELPDIGRVVAASEECAVAESVKAAAAVYSPVGGEVLAVNEALTDHPELINEDPYGTGWLFRLQPSNGLKQLLDATAYAAVVEAAA